jgi:FAD synthase
MRVRVQDRLRAERRFESSADLSAQIAQDLHDARAALRADADEEAPR